MVESSGDRAWVIEADEPKVREVISPGDERVLGRDHAHGADLVLHSVTVARRHGILRNRGGALEVEDLQSHCGIFVNLERIGGRVVTLAEGDEVRIGQIVLRVSRA